MQEKYLEKSISVLHINEILEKFLKVCYGCIMIFQSVYVRLRSRLGLDLEYYTIDELKK